MLRTQLVMEINAPIWGRKLVSIFLREESLIHVEVAQPNKMDGGTIKIVDDVATK